MRTALLPPVILLSILMAHVPAHESVAVAAPKKAQRNEKKGGNKKSKKLRFAKEDWRQVGHPLFGAVYDNDVKNVVALLKKNKKAANATLGGKYADADKVHGLIGDTPLTFAAWKGHDRIATLLLKAGAKMDAKDNAGMTPLHWAAQYGYHKVVVQLVQAGASVGAKNKAGKKPVDLTIDEKVKAYLEKAGEQK